MSKEIETLEKKADEVADAAGEVAAAAQSAAEEAEEIQDEVQHTEEEMGESSPIFTSDAFQVDTIKSLEQMKSWQENQTAATAAILSETNNLRQAVTNLSDMMSTMTAQITDLSARPEPPPMEEPPKQTDSRDEEDRPDREAEQKTAPKKSRWI